MTPAQLKTALANDVDNLKNYIDVGESLIITESLTGLEQLSAAILANIPAAPTVDARSAVNEIVLSRLHIFRKDQNTIQVFKDNGELAASSSRSSSRWAPTWRRIRWRRSRRSIRQGRRTRRCTRSTSIPIRWLTRAFSRPQRAGLDAAHRLHRNARGDLRSRPRLPSISATPRPRRNSCSACIARSSRSGKINVTLPDGTTGKFLSLSKGSQTGTSFQSVASKRRRSCFSSSRVEPTFVVDTRRAPDPGLTFLGSSKTRQVSFQARLAPGHHDALLQPIIAGKAGRCRLRILQTLVNQLSRSTGSSCIPDGFEGT